MVIKKEWVPDSVHKFATECKGISDDQKEMLNRLITDKHLASFWHSLQKRLTEKYGLKEVDLHLFFFTSNVLTSYGWSVKEAALQKPTRSESKQLYKSIANHSEKLISSIKQLKKAKIGDLGCTKINQDLTLLSTEAIRMIDHIDDQVWYVSQSKGNVARTFFIRRMSLQMEEIFLNSYTSNLASLAYVCLDDNAIDFKTVENCLSSWNNREEFRAVMVRHERNCI